jgi:DNA-binding winged helix-turn-helix (wHTH) protein
MAQPTDAGLTAARPGANLVRFGVFELDTHTGELRKFGARIKLADQPFRILVALLGQPGELITRDHLRERVWPGEEAGDFEQGLNRAVSKLRDALSDRAAHPRFIETLPGRGYRFIGTVQTPTEESVLVPQRRRRVTRIVVPALLMISLLAVAARLLVPPSINPLRWRKLTTDSYMKIPPALSDGTRVYFAAYFEGEQFLAEVPLSGGHPARLPITPPGPTFILHDLSPDGQEFLLTAAATSDRLHLMPLWTLRIADGSARRLGSIVATSAAFSPSGKTIAYTTSTELWTARGDGTQARRLLEMKDSLAGSICWSRDGTRIRFSRRDPLSRFSVPWEIEADGSAPRNLLPGGGVSRIPEGWALDGKMAIFFGGGSFWARYESWLRKDRPLEPVVADAPEFDGFVRMRGGSVFHAVGTDRLGELQSYDEATGVWSPLLDGISAEAVEYSPDGQRVAYVTYPQRTLWVRQADGKRPIQLTSQPLVASYPRWSPDGKRIAFGANESDEKPMRLYLVDAEGGPVSPAVPSAPGSQGYPTWSPDGKTLLYGIVNNSLREEAYIRAADLETGRVTKLPGSDGLFAPRWSPDGRAIAALRFTGDRNLALLRISDKHWQEMPGRRVDWPAWMPDSKSILCVSGGIVLRYHINSGKFEIITQQKPSEIGGYSRWIGTSFRGSPLRTLNRDSPQIYALQLDIANNF